MKILANLMNTICDILSKTFLEGRCFLSSLLKSRKTLRSLGTEQNFLHRFFENKIEGLFLQTKGEFVTFKKQD